MFVVALHYEFLKKEHFLPTTKTKTTHLIFQNQIIFQNKPTCMDLKIILLIQVVKYGNSEAKNF